MGKVHRFIPPNKRPRTFTSNEKVIEYLAEEVITCHKTYSQLGRDMKLSPSTIGKMARRETKWPRPKTFFALLLYFDIELVLTKKG